MFDDGGKNCDTIFTLNPSRKKKTKRQRRFNDDQIKSLESIFRYETKLEPRKKLQVATQLGLQPRQVAIWFQNKRARFKSKQLERDHSLLRTKYNSMLSQLESLKQEKHQLVLQLQNLNNQIEDGKEDQSDNGVISFKDKCFGLEEDVSLMDMAETSMTWPANWSQWEAQEDLVEEESTSNYQWWDFWS